MFDYTQKKETALCGSGGCSSSSADIGMICPLSELDNNINLLDIQEHIDQFSKSERGIVTYQDKKQYSQLLGVTYKELAEQTKNDRFNILAKRVGQCGDVLEFALFNDGKIKLKNAFFCKNRLCSMCNWRKSLKTFNQISDCMNYIQKHNSDVRYLFLTLTIKNVSGNDLNNAIDHLLKSFRKMFNNSVDRKKWFLGCVRSLEITINKNKRSSSFGTFHPHLHIILAVKESYFEKDNFIDFNHWQALWKKFAGLDYNPSIKVNAIHNKADGTPDHKAIKEVSKYSVKGSDYLVDNISENVRRVNFLDAALFNRRLFSMTGEFAKARKRLKLADLESFDADLTDSFEIRQDLINAIITYKWGSMGYQIKEIKKTDVFNNNGDLPF